MPQLEVAYLGPIGTYSHLVAEKRFGSRAKLIPMATIHDVCKFASKQARRRGIVPIENSSGGAIYETVDILLAAQPKVHIIEEISLEVNLALLGHKGHPVKVLYSHFAPLEHSQDWIKKNLSSSAKKASPSTAVAAQTAAGDLNAAALGSRRLAKIYGLNILHYPVEADIINLTSFLAIGGKEKVQEETDKTTIAVRLENKPGSLCSLLECFRNANVNLSKLISRPLRGCPNEYVFLVDLQGGLKDSSLKDAIKSARDVSAELRLIGSYPARRRYTS